MARPAPPERSRSARSSRQLSRFYHSINPDRVFGTHNIDLLSQDQVFRFQRCSRLEARSQDTENQREQISHQDASLRRPLAASTPNRIFGTHTTKKDALDAAIGFLAQGMKDVTITDEKGQIFSTSEFVDLIENPPTK
jgi:hypothetical protein